MRATLVLAGGALALTACTSVPDGTGTPGDTCRQEPGQRFIGQRATAQVGAAILQATGSRTIRWVPPDTVVTADYGFGRVTVSYDRNNAITRVSCG